MGAGKNGGCHREAARPKRRYLLVAGKRSTHPGYFLARANTTNEYPATSILRFSHIGSPEKPWTTASHSNQPGNSNPISGKRLSFLFKIQCGITSPTAIAAKRFYGIQKRKRPFCYRFGLFQSKKRHREFHPEGTALGNIQ